MTKSADGTCTNCTVLYPELLLSGDTKSQKGSNRDSFEKKCRAAVMEPLNGTEVVQMRRRASDNTGKQVSFENLAAAAGYRPLRFPPTQKIALDILLP
jgi:hypothetical protein